MQEIPQVFRRAEYIERTKLVRGVTLLVVLLFDKSSDSYPDTGESGETYDVEMENK